MKASDRTLFLLTAIQSSPRRMQGDTVLMLRSVVGNTVELSRLAHDTPRDFVPISTEPCPRDRRAATTKPEAPAIVLRDVFDTLDYLLGQSHSADRSADRQADCRRAVIVTS
jgi:hypothetical protein